MGTGERKNILAISQKKPLRLLKNSWARYDFEGFYGILLKKNSYWSDKYLDW